MPPNAFVEPTNPDALFPQIAKPNIWDFRSHRMATGGRTAVHNFRKIHSEASKKSKYASVVKTTEELVDEEASMTGENEQSEQEEAQVAQSKPKKDLSVNDIMDLDRLTIGKKQAVVNEQSKGIKKPNKKKARREKQMKKKQGGLRR